jgi:hypothetical protein
MLDVRIYSIENPTGYFDNQSTIIIFPVFHWKFHTKRKKTDGYRKLKVNRFEEKNRLS